MRRWKKRNHKFWAIVRAKSKRNYGRRKHSGGLRIHGVVKKYHNKGKFDYLTYLRKSLKPHKKKWVSHYKGSPRTKPSDYERKGRSPLDALKAWANSLGHYE